MNLYFKFTLGSWWNRRCSAASCWPISDQPGSDYSHVCIVWYCIVLGLLSDSIWGCLIFHHSFTISYDFNSLMYHCRVVVLAFIFPYILIACIPLAAYFIYIVIYFQPAQVSGKIDELTLGRDSSLLYLPLHTIPYHTIPYHTAWLKALG